MELLAMTITPVGVVMGILSLIAGISTGAHLLRKDSGIEERRGVAVDAVPELKEIGWDELSEVIKAYAVGDYSLLMTRILEFMRNIAKPGKLIEVARRSFYKMLPRLLDDENDREKILKIIAPHLTTGKKKKS